MPNASVVKTLAQPRGLAKQAARRRLVPSQRDPVHLPVEEVELPSPPQSPGPPPAVNLITSVLPPVVILGGTLIFSLIQGGINWMVMGPMLIMSMGFPIANLAGVSFQKKAYKRQLEERKDTYNKQLKGVRNRLDILVTQQRGKLEKAYPNLSELKRIAKEQGRLLWTRRPNDDDFLALRIGAVDGAPSFLIEHPRFLDPNDNLSPLAEKIASSYQSIAKLPWLLPLGEVGSVALTGRSSMAIYSLAYRLVIDLLVHHSPRDVKLAVLGDTRQAVEKWEWLKWLPHTGVLNPSQSIPWMAFETYKINKILEYLNNEFQARRRQVESMSGSTISRKQTAIVVLLDDSGDIRQRGDIAQLAEWGHEFHIHLVFIGGRDWPPECRSRVEVLDREQFKYIETWTKSGETHSGDFESASQSDCEAIAKSLAGFDVPGSETKTPLPENIRLSQVIGLEKMVLDAVKENWSQEFKSKDLLHFPIGICSKRDQLDLSMINLLPAERGGEDAYHTILIGTTGSGKSEFMKSLVMDAALRYPPSQLNFFFMDFKGGAAFSVFDELPHVSGIVTNLSPELVERGLDSVENEIGRRQGEFSRAKVQNIWTYNQLNIKRPLPHMVLLLDEFARGLAEFPRLRDTLDVLTRQGRSLGMYLILANQDVNAQVDNLLTNVGWRIALKVAKPEELGIIERGLPNAVRPGQGYLRSLNGDVTEFQSGYAGLPVQSDSAVATDEYTIYSIDSDGSYTKYFKKINTAIEQADKAEASFETEEIFIVNLLKQAKDEMHVRSAQRIYLPPLRKEITLDDVLRESGVPLIFERGKWKKENPSDRLVAFLGDVDMPQACLQELLQVDFEERDGHLWIVGTGKDTALTSLVMSLALTKTPEQLQFYMLELGAGELHQFEKLPHTGAVINPLISGEDERLKRLIRLLDVEMKRRTLRRPRSGKNVIDEKHPSIFIVINNFAELQTNYPDEVSDLTRLIRDGIKANIHMIVTTSRGPELIRSFASNIARRLVLQLASRDEYMDLVGRQVKPMHVEVPGRAYWVDGNPLEAQVAQPMRAVVEMVEKMNSAWKGKRPTKIETLPDCLPLAKILSKKFSGIDIIPVGQSYENLEYLLPKPSEGSPYWIVLGPQQSGKSNFIACAAKSVLQLYPNQWTVQVLSLRRKTMLDLPKEIGSVQVASTMDEIITVCKKLNEAVRNGEPIAEGKKLLLLVDDLGAAYQIGKESVANELNALGLLLEDANDIRIIATGLFDELRMQMTSQFLKVFRQSRYGLVLSKDMNELDWLGAQISLEYRRMDLPIGRGFFVMRGKPILVQTPFLGHCSEE